MRSDARVGAWKTEAADLLAVLWLTDVCETLTLPVADSDASPFSASTALVAAAKPTAAGDWRKLT